MSIEIIVIAPLNQLSFISIIAQEEHLAGVNRIIAAASVLEDPEQVKKAQHIQEKIRLQTLEQTFVNAKY
jgi:hypothetical protein